jgi:cathepsin B
MYKLVVVGTILAFTQAHIHPVNEEIIAQIKARATTWEPMEMEENPLHHMSLETVKGMLGTIYDTDSDFPEPIMSASNAALPTSFDARTQWGSCVHAIRDQASCGSCWAFGASEALTDRFCIASSGKTDVVLSPEDMVACDSADLGCDGGYLNKAWNYLATTGIVSDACFPYTSGKGTVPSCPRTCTGSGTWTKYKCKANSVVTARTAAAIQQEIYTNGPMETSFNVYSDFMNYKSGIYQHTSGYLEGGHAIKILGWGVEGGLKYWLCANSWGTSWGEKGFFRIAYGECGIDSAVYACTPTVTVADFTA